MPVDATTRKALDINSLTLPSGIAVNRLEADEYTDWTGEPSLRVLVVLDESVDVDKLSGEAVGELKFAIAENLRKNGVTLFPYIFLAKPSELTATDEE